VSCFIPTYISVSVQSPTVKHESRRSGRFLAHLSKVAISRQVAPIVSCKLFAVGRTKAVAEGFGDRILRLAGERSLADVAKVAGLRYGLVWRWTRRPDPPKGMRDRIALLERALGGPLIDDEDQPEKGETEMLNEPRLPYERDPERYIQPLDFKKRALDEVGRARHELAAALAAMQEGMSDPRQIATLIERADEYAAKAQRHLLGKIKVNDQGEKV